MTAMVVDNHDVVVAVLVGGFGDDAAEFRNVRTRENAAAVDTDMISNSIPH